MRAQNPQPGEAGPTRSLIFGIVAGEPSGDALGAALMAELRARHPDVSFVGIGGPRMCAQGMESMVPMQRLTMHGFVDPVRRLPDLLRIYWRLRTTFLQARVDAFIGVDFNVFNLIVERSLRKRGVRTVHYVSPSVYAWRRGRIHRVARAADLLLTLFPFEPALYRGTTVRAVFVGHPLADELAHVREGDRDSARRTLDIEGAPLIALLPGSRRSEVELMGGLFLATAERVLQQHPQARFVVPCVNPLVRAQLEAQLHMSRLASNVTLLDGRSRLALAAADAVLVKSGTATLEALLLEKPMVVAYRLGALTAAIVRRLLRTPFVALPNILAGRLLVPELLQEAATPDALADALEQVLQHPSATRTELRAIGDSLRRGASARAAEAVLELATTPR